MKLAQKASWKLAQKVNDLINKECNTNTILPETGKPLTTIIALAEYCELLGIDLTKANIHQACGSPSFSHVYGKDITGTTYQDTFCK